VFAPELEGLDRAAIRDWYNGYRWRGTKKVYNPFDILLLFTEREFSPYWFETGSPAFLIETLERRRVLPLELDGMVASNDLLSAFDVDHMTSEALLFQTGYLTIAKEQCLEGSTYYHLGYPNREVRESLNRSLLHAIAWGSHSEQTANHARLHLLLFQGDLSGLEAHFRALFVGIPYNWHMNNLIARHGGYYASVLYAHFAALGAPVVVEDAGAGGRVYLFEFKMAERANAGAALAQIRARGYADKYQALGQPIHLVGVEFSAEERNLVAFETASC